MLYRRTDDVERLQKVIANTEQQFAGYLQQIKTLGEEKEQWQKELEDLRGAAQKLVDMVDPQEDGKAGERPCWSEFSERRRRSSSSSLKPRSRVSATLFPL
jgi:predicted  nucleic acid-binding Zn-ribbon protein